MERREDFVSSFICWVTDGFVVVFGLWTILCHVAVRAHRGFSFLVLFSPLVPLSAAAVLFLLARLRRRGPAFLPEYLQPEEDVFARIPHAAGLAGAGLLAFFYVFSRSYIFFWSASCLFLGFFYFKHFRSPGFRPARPEKRRSEAAVFFSLVLAALALFFFLHRPDQDDSFYLSVPVQAMENPEVPLFRGRLMTGYSREMMLPTFTVHSVELAAGILARLLGTRPITAAHLILPAIFVLFFVCAASRLLRLLMGGTWLYGLAALLFVLTANGDIHWSYGNFSLVRFFQGKSLLPSGVVPLLAAYSLEYISREKRGIWPLLFFGQVSGLGLSSAGLYVGPLTVGFSLLGCWRPDKKTTGRLFLGALSAVYPLAMGLFLRFGPMLANPAFLEGDRRVPAVPELLDKIFGPGVFFWVWLLTLLGGWTVFRDQARRRWVLGFSLAYLLLFLNPFLNFFWARHLLGVETMWRILWVLPLPVWLAVLLTSVSGTAASLLGRRRARAAVFALLLVLFGLLVPARWTVSRSNRTEVRWPSLKVPPDDFRLAEQTAALTDRGRYILAPEAISVWVPTITRMVYVVASREFSLVMIRNRIFSAEGREDISRRLAMLKYISGTFRPGTKDQSREMLLQALEHYRVQTVVLPRSNPWRHEIETALRESGFQKMHLSGRGYFLYRRT